MNLEVILEPLGEFGNIPEDAQRLFKRSQEIASSLFRRAAIFVCFSHSMSPSSATRPGTFLVVSINTCESRSK